MAQKPKKISPQPRSVIAFGVESRQKNTQVQPPPSAKVLNKKITKNGPAAFRKAYERGDLPIKIDHNSQGKKIEWKIPPNDVDYDNYLPLFFDGLSEMKYPYNFLAEQAVHDIIDSCQETERILAVLPYIIQPIRKTLNLKDPHKICVVSRILIKLATRVENCGQALVPYYRQLLPVFGQFKNKNLNIGDGIEYGQHRKSNLGDVIEDTLECLEKTGGPEAFINIQYLIPTYQSCRGSR